MAVAVVLVACTGRPAPGSPLSRGITQRAYALAYDLQFEEAHQALAEAIKADPSDPAPLRAMAAVTWVEILFAQGVATFEAFSGEISKSDVVRPPAPVALTARFAQAVAKARALADRQLSASDHADAHYQVGATAVLSALYAATVEGRTLAGLLHGRRAVSAMRHARTRAPQVT